MSTTAVSITSVTNSTSSGAGPDLSYWVNELYSRYIPISIVATITNLTLLVVLCSTRELRAKPFYWGVSSLCVVDFITGIFILPLGLEYEIAWEWRHSSVLCKLWRVADLSRLPIVSCIVLCICLERILAKIAVIYIMRENVVRIISMILVSTPWLILAAVVLPTYITIEDKFDMGNSCSFGIKRSDVIYIIPLFLALPVILILIAMYGMLITYVYKGDTRKMFEEDRSKSVDEKRLRMSIVVTWFVGTVNVALWLPRLVNVIYLTSCSKMCCYSNWETDSRYYTVYGATTTFTPCRWLILDDARKSLYSKFNWIKSKIIRRD